MPQLAEAEGLGPRPDDSDEIDLRAYWRVLMRRRWVVLGTFAAAVLLTLVLTLRQTHIFAATATIIIEQSAPKVLNAKDVQDVADIGGNFWSSKEYYETQYKVITSRAVSQRVIEKLQLAHDLRFLGLEGLKDDALQKALARADAVSELQERLSVLPVKDSRVVRILVEDRDPKWAATLANAVAEAYITETLSVRSSMAQGASDWLETQLADLEAKLAKSGDALFKFKQERDIVSTSWEDRQSIVSQRIVAINDALTKARVQKAQLSARNEQLAEAVEALKNDPQSPDGTMLLTQNMAIPELKVRYLDAKVDCADQAARYLENHPKAQACAAKVAAAKSSLDKEISGTLEAAKREYEEAVQAERKLQKLLDETKSDSFGLNQFEKEYLELKRSHDNNQRLYEMVLSRLKETGVTGMLQMSNVRILDRAETPELPVRPRAVRNMLLAALLGAVLGVGLAFLLEMLDTSVTTREQIEERLGIPFLGIIPNIEAKDGVAPELTVFSAPASAAAECVRTIRTNLLFMSPDRPLRTILVTSSGPGEGKTTTAVALAETMAGGGSRVLLVDADMRRPRLHKVFGVNGNSGLSALILGDGSVESTIVRTAIPGVDVLPCGPIPPNPAELLHTEGFARLLQQFRDRYDRVIIDSPPAGVVADAVVMSTQVDGTLLVVKAGETSRDAAIRTTRALVDVNARVFGAVLNDLDLEDQRYGQYYNYYRSGYYTNGEAKPKVA